MVSRDVVPFVLANSPQDKIYVTKVDLDTDVSLGHFKRYRESIGLYAEPDWIFDVRYAANLNQCWRRFVCCKEIMHVFDDASANTDTKEKFEILLKELALRPPNPSPMAISESIAVWKAMAALAPKRIRHPLRDLRANGEIDDYEIALKLLIPEAYIPHIMAPAFDETIEFISQPA